MNFPDPGGLAAAALRLPADARVDAVVGYTSPADGPPGTLDVRFASGARLTATVTVPLKGVLRVSVGDGPDVPADSPMLTPLPVTPAPLVERDGRIVADGVLFGGAGEFQAGPLVRATADGAMGLPGLPAGRVLVDGRPFGFVERFRLEPGAAVFGGGESAQGPDLRGRIRTLRNAETVGAVGYDLSYLNVPFFWSDAGWGVFAHTGGEVRADLGATSGELMSLAIPGPRLDLFFLSGPPDEMLRRYLALTGLPGALPDWALGVWLSRCSYLSESHLHDVIDRAREADCPVDVLHVDGWQDGNPLEDLACNWSMDRSRFPEGWVRRITRRGPKVSLWLNPYVPRHAPAAGPATAAGVFARDPRGEPAHTPDIPGRLVVDFTGVDGPAWWRERLRDLHESEGFDALKADFGEEVPEDAGFADGRAGALLRNEYALRYQAATHAFATELTGTPPAMFCRSGTAGAQRYPCHWVGDSASTWEGLTTALRACLSLSLSGFAWVAHDIGGFWAERSGDAHVRGFAAGDPGLAAADVDPELFLRWAQWGAFSPVMRFHGTGVREPFGYPEPYGGYAVEAARLRRALRPYLRRVAAEAAAHGTPVMRPMALAFPEYREARDTLQYLLGPDLLVAPILRPGGRVRLWTPPGRWRRLLGSASLTGPGFTEVTCDLSEVPVFVRVSRSVPDWYPEFVSSATVSTPSITVRRSE